MKKNSSALLICCGLLISTIFGVVSLQTVTADNKITATITTPPKSEEISSQESTLNLGFGGARAERNSQQKKIIITTNEDAATKSKATSKIKKKIKKSGKELGEEKEEIIIIQ